MATSTALKHRPSLSSTKSSTNANTNANTKFSCDPHVLYIIQGIVRDLQFLCDGGYITRIALDEIIDKLPKPVTHFIPNNTPAASPSPSPVGMHNLPSDINTQVTASRASVNSTSNTDSQTDSPLMKDDDFFDVDEEIMKRHASERFEDDESAIAYGVSSTGEEASFLDGRMEYMREAEERSLRSLASTTDHEAITTQSDVTSQSSQNRRMMRSPAPSTTSSRVVNTHPYPVNDMYPNSSASSPTETYAPSRTTAISSLALPPPESDAPMPQRGGQSQNVQYVSSQSQQSRSRRASSVAAPAYLAIVEALWEFADDDDGDLTFRKGDVLEVIEFVNSDWWRGRCLRTGKMGIFPRVYARILHMNQNGSSFHQTPSTYYTTRPQLQQPSAYPSHSLPQNAQV